MYEKMMAVVLRGSNYRDYDKMLTLFTRENGRVDALARGCRKQGSPLLAASDVFCCAEYEFFKKGDRYFITQCALKEAFFDLRKNMRALMTATALAEVCEKTAMPDAPSPRLFALLVNSLYALNRGMDAQAAFSYFVFRLLDILGLRPVLNHCVVCGKAERAGLDVVAGGAVCASHGGEPVRQEVFADIEAVLETPPKRMAAFGASLGESVYPLAKKWLISALEQPPKSLTLLELMLPNGKNTEKNR